MAGRLLVGRGEVELGQMACMNRRAGLMSKAGRLVLSQSWSGLVDVGGAGRVVAVAATVVIVALRLSPPGSYTNLLLLLLLPPGSYVRLWSLLSVALGLLLSGVSVLSVSMVSALVLLEGQRELKDGGCGE